MKITTVGLDIAKLVFQVHGADAEGRAVLRKRLRRSQVEFLREPATVCRGAGGLLRSSLLGTRDQPVW